MASKNFNGWLQRIRKTGEYSDVTVKVRGHEFRLHKLPLLNESLYFRSLPTCSASSSDRVIEINDLPGGIEAFAAAMDFCYIIRPAYSTSNIAQIRGVADFLGMSDLMDSTKKFLYNNVFCSWKSCIAYLQGAKKIYPPTDEYIESRSLRVIFAACTKTFLATKHLSIPINHFSLSITDSTMAVAADGNFWSGSSPCQMLKEMLFHVATLPECFATQLMDILVESNVNLSIKCRQSRSAREWLQYVIRDESKDRNSKVWIVLCLAKMLLKNAPNKKPLLELSSQYYCSLLEHTGLLITEVDGDTGRLKSIKDELEQRIGTSLHELDDYLHSFNFTPVTLHSLISQFLKGGAPEDIKQEIGAVANEVDECLVEYAECGSISVDMFVALEEVFPSNARYCHDTLYAAVLKMFENNRQVIAVEDAERMWGFVDCSKLSTPAYEKAMNNASYTSQPHVLECVLKRYSEELSAEDEHHQQPDLREIMQKVIHTSLKLLEENSRRSKEITELQIQYAGLLNSGKIQVVEYSQAECITEVSSSMCHSSEVSSNPMKSED